MFNYEKRTLISTAEVRLECLHQAIKLFGVVSFNGDTVDEILKIATRFEAHVLREDPDQDGPDSEISFLGMDGKPDQEEQP